MSVDQAAAPVLADLRQTGWQHEALLRWLRRSAPVLLMVFVAAAFLAHPAPGWTGRRLVVSCALAAFLLGVLGRNATFGRAGYVHSVSVGLLLAGGVLLMWVQPSGPGAEAVLLGVLSVSRLLPARVAPPVMVIAFLAVEMIAWMTHRDELAVLTALGCFYGMLYLTHRMREANLRAERLLAELEQSQAAQAQAAGLAERQRLAREMHDVLAHSLSGLILQLEAARLLAAGNPGDPRIPEAVERAHQLGKAGLDEARRAIGMLRDDELPGPERLAGLAERFQRDNGIACEFTVSGVERRLGSEARLAVYRVAQEALTNVARHADPQRVELRLVYQPSAVHLTVEDFGAVAAAPAADGTGGYGLTGMRERAELLGGTLSTEPTPAGFRVELEVPT